ncbi:MAG: 2-dehydropantoate 2-reductase N-terminal domain-containing protein, partial [Myxococcota bacterium]|nr:2-dehydropantoate 2-reductase N-terminal domain-containing protein [Myxococcota bacterium]
MRDPAASSDALHEGDPPAAALRGVAVVVGAGSVGLTLAARLRRAGLPVRVATRRAEAARALAGGLVAEDPATGATQRLDVEATAELDAALAGDTG